MKKRDLALTVTVTVTLRGVRKCSSAQFPFMHYSSKQSNLETAEILKNNGIRKFEHDILSILLTVTSSETRRENSFLNGNSNYMIKNCLGDQTIC